MTNILDDQELTAEQASLIYRQRWGIELQFRALKQTYGKAKLRARTPEIAEIELHWSLLGLTMLQLLARKNRPAGEPAEKDQHCCGAADHSLDDRGAIGTTSAR